MYFVIGLICLVLAVFTSRVLGVTPFELRYLKRLNVWDYVATLLLIVGGALALGSICFKLWYLMP